MQPTLNIAVKAARKAGAIINRSSLDLERSNISFNHLGEYALETSRLSEEAISEILLNAYPDHYIIVNKNEILMSDKEFKWVICSLDGLSNFSNGFPFYSISISLMQYNNIIQSVVYDPIRNELFTASRGGGTFLNDRRIRVSGKHKLDNSLLAIDKIEQEYFDVNLNINKILKNCMDIRKIGSSSLALAYVACGRLDGFLGSGLNISEISSGSLLISESGGLVADYAGEQNLFETGQMLAATPKIFAAIVSILNK
ncbi:myo-inositol-1(or 4)-monophosphatase [Candidatus Kinetoplastibacterium desouzaii TCC079E]|uniref:Inositol-1-monophosphatase n=1 Tax=Candidatus Kinetoplastidibacterium desouzai TCC079E TaxID=1208919 RepID=M1LTU1_9PROT|nr:inositol monophosphatase family protein [Candidatus Kinetoplastibacterium desouzaii]AGF46714.1 myo-inositol-1(or 4)-monophosphatase [Candidatus Kinetoplastibacterium desouzaii TCC079E]